MNTPKIWCEPAECYSGCDDPRCPYTHWSSWHREGDQNGYAARVVDHLIERESELIDAIAGERRLREQLADALARATGRLETRVAAAEGAMQEMIEVGRKADAEIERLRAALEEAIKSARVGDAPHVIVIAQRALKD